MTSPYLKFGVWSAEELAATDVAISDIRAFKDRFASNFAENAEFFEPSMQLDVGSRKTRISKLKFYNQTSLLHAMLLKYEFGFKLLSSLDGYVVAVENKQPMLVYLAARYCLELLATLNFVSNELTAAKTADLRDWEGRGNRFLTALCRSRFATSDAKIAIALKSLGVSSSALKPVGITEAVKALASGQFPTAVIDYDFLSNLCHHNGSGHKIFGDGIRETDRVRLPTGEMILLPKTCSAVTFVYPPRAARASSIVKTANLVLQCAKICEAILLPLPTMPFENAEIESLTGCQINAAIPALVSTRASAFTEKTSVNASCPCGSGHKFKRCCGRRA